MEVEEAKTKTGPLALIDTSAWAFTGDFGVHVYAIILCASPIMFFSNAHHTRLQAAPEKANCST